MTGTPLLPTLRDAWRLSLGTLTALPTRPPERVTRRVAGVAMALAPMAALPLGAAVTLIGGVGSHLDLPTPVIAVIAVGALAAGTRAFHLDGLSDTVDGLTASYDRERSLAVMRTGTSGPAGTAALIIVLGLQAVALAALFSIAPPWRGAVLAGVAVCVSRGALAAACVRGVRSARPDGLGAAVAETVSPVVVAITWTVSAAALGLVGHWAGLAWWRGPAAAAVAFAVVGELLRRTRRRFGGVTGDVLGAAVELALAALVVSLS